MGEFLGMGGYAAYVWPAFCLTLAVLVGFVVVSLRRLRRTRRQLAALEAARQSLRAKRRQAAGPSSLGQS